MTTPYLGWKRIWVSESPPNIDGKENNLSETAQYGSREKNILSKATLYWDEKKKSVSGNTTDISRRRKGSETSHVWPIAFRERVTNVDHSSNLALL